MRNIEQQTQICTEGNVYICSVSQPEAVYLKEAADKANNFDGFVSAQQ